MKPFLCFSLGLFLAAGGLAETAPGAGPAAKYKIVFHVNFDGEDRLNEVVAAVENTQRAFGPENVDIVVVAHSAGAGLVTKGDEKRARRIAAATEAGAKFNICTFTAASRKLTDEDLLPGVKRVPGGIPEVVRRQEQGYYYIKLY